MTNDTPSGAEKRRKSTEPESRQMAKMFFFRRASSNLRDVGFHTKQAVFFTEQCTSLSLFSRLEVT